MVRLGAGGCSGIAPHRTDGSRHRQGGQDHQHDEADSMSPAHPSSIARGTSQERPQRGRGRVHREVRLRRSALPMTDTELKVIAALAIMGLSSNPRLGYNTPAATGTPSTL